jgi:single-stranded DNA-binding protein
MAKIEITGNVGKLETGRGVVRFSVCENHSRKVNEKWEVTPLWFNCKAFKETAKKMTDMGVTKGTKVVVVGIQKPHIWDDATGKKVVSVEVTASDVKLAPKFDKKNVGATESKSAVAGEIPW